MEIDPLIQSLLDEIPYDINDDDITNDVVNDTSVNSMFYESLDDELREFPYVYDLLAPITNKNVKDKIFTRSSILKTRNIADIVKHYLSQSPNDSRRLEIKKWLMQSFRINLFRKETIDLISKKTNITFALIDYSPFSILNIKYEFKKHNLTFDWNEEEYKKLCRALTQDDPEELYRFIPDCGYSHNNLYKMLWLSTYFNATRCFKSLLQENERIKSLLHYVYWEYEELVLDLYEYAIYHKNYEIFHYLETYAHPTWGTLLCTAQSYNWEIMEYIIQRYDDIKFEPNDLIYEIMKYVM